ncbi:glycosyltransferase family 4 protein [Amycolatopsis anabasis]|uniref:glycosyltransferase family 4 protein n=1 Tax=Amycolatopsis anabasis TaxID=1840409 RepID=UPI00131D2643|nr:glycosyltransferase family 4 protein [Amycolatopsis anabasis]
MTGRTRNILVVFGGYREVLAGAERMAWRTLEQLSARGHRVVILTDSLGWIRETPAGCPRFSSEAELRRGLPGWRPDVVHAFDLAKPDLVDLAWRLARHHGAAFALTPASASRVWPEPRRAAALCEAADVLFTLNEAEAEGVRGIGIPADRIRRIPHAADLAGHPDPGGFRRRYGLTGELVLFAGRRVAFKGYRTLLRATRLVWRRLPGVSFVFLGPDGDADAAETFRAHADPRVLDLGMVDEQTKHDALAACALLCLPTSADVFPLVFAEAWACAKPVVTGEYPGAREVVRDQIDGLVVPARPEPVAAALIALLTDHETRTAMGRAGKARAADEFGWDKVAAEVETGYQSAERARTGGRA